MVLVASSVEAQTRVGAEIFAGIGPSIFHNSSGTGGSRQQSEEKVGRMVAAGGGLTFGFGGPVGASVTLRGGGSSGPRFVVTDSSQPAGTSLELSLSDVRLVGISFGAPISIGRSFVVEPMLDLTKWTVTDTTTVVVNQVRSPTTVDRSGTDPGVGVRAAWFPSRRVGVGYEFHFVKLRDAAPAIAIGPGWIEDNQSLISVYVRWNR